MRWRRRAACRIRHRRSAPWDARHCPTSTTKCGASLGLSSRSGTGSQSCRGPPGKSIEQRDRGPRHADVARRVGARRDDAGGGRQSYVTLVGLALHRQRRLAQPEAEDAGPRGRRVSGRTLADRAAMIGQDDVAAGHRNVEQRLAAGRCAPKGTAETRARRRAARSRAAAAAAYRRAKHLQCAVRGQHVAIGRIAAVIVARLSSCTTCRCAGSASAAAPVRGPMTSSSRRKSPAARLGQTAPDVRLRPSGRQ